MDLDLTEDQEMLKSVAREFLEKEALPAFAREMEQDARGFTPELWQKLAQMGWLGLPIPEAYGGTGQSLFDLGILMEEVGAALLPGPFFNTALCALALADSATEEQKRLYLRRIASGDLIATAALEEVYGDLDPAGIQMEATRRGDGWVLNGTKFLVENAHVADYLLVAARTQRGANPQSGITLFWVDARAPGIRVEKLKTLANDHQCEVQFHEVTVPAGGVIGAAGQGWPLLRQVLQKGAMLRAFQMVGALQRVLDLTVEYVKNRVQFGRALGSFQIVQHACANMAADVDGSRYVGRQAMWALSEGLPADLQVSAAKAYVSDSVERACANAHQAHGSIGFTREYDLQLYTRRLRAWEVSFGDADYHRDRVVEAMKI